MSINGNGISVSVPSSPRTSSPRTPPVSSPRAPRIEEMGLGAPLKKRYEDAHEDAHEDASISPRMLFTLRDVVARRLEFYSSGEWSPIPLASSPSPPSPPSTASAFIASLDATQPIVVVPEDTVGECNVCYMALPPRSNHVFTPCGHLFCVKCMLLWWDTSATCAMCRGEILDLADGGGGGAAAAAGFESDSDDNEEEEGDDVRPNFQFFLARAIADRASADRAIADPAVHHQYYDDDSVGGREVEPPRPISAIDQYLHIDADVEWASLHGGTGTNPAGDDWGIILSRRESLNLRLNRDLASMLWARRRFNETLFSNIDFLGETFHTFIEKRHWPHFINAADMGPHRMFEFVMCRTNVHNRGYETNFFGYISQFVVVDADRSYDGFADWENTHECAFVVHVFSPTTPPYNNAYNIDDGSFETTELIFRFAEIRRLYSIQSTERSAV